MFAIRLTTNHRSGGTRRRYWYGRTLKSAIACAPATLRGRNFHYTRACRAADAVTGLVCNIHADLWSPAHLSRDGRTISTPR